MQILILSQSAKCRLANPTISDVLSVAYDLPQDEIDQLEAFSGKPFDPEEVSLWLINGLQHKWGIYAEGQPIVVGGVGSCGPNNWRTMFLARNGCWDKHAKEITAKTRYCMYNILDLAENTRIETVCLESRKRAQAWYRVVGLRKESILSCYGANGESAVMYVKTKDG